jgi:hypothetical protein
MTHKIKTSPKFREIRYIRLPCWDHESFGDWQNRSRAEFAEFSEDNLVDSTIYVTGSIATVKAIIGSEEDLVSLQMKYAAEIICPEDTLSNFQWCTWSKVIHPRDKVEDDG